MKDLILFTSTDICLTHIRQLISDAEYLVSIDDSELYLQSKSNENDFFKIRTASHTIESFDSDELSFVSKYLGSHKVFLCNYRSVRFAKCIVQIIAKEIPSIVDNDFDGLMTDKEFIEKTNIEPEWDWTT